MLGYSAEEWRTMHLWRERLHPHDARTVLEAVARSESTGEPFELEFRYLARDGRVVWVYDRATLLQRHDDGTPQRFQGVMIDITARRSAEEQAAEVERRFRELLEQGPSLTFAYRVDADERMEMEYVNPRMGELLGYPSEELLTGPDAGWRSYIRTTPCAWQTSSTGQRGPARRGMTGSGRCVPTARSYGSAAVGSASSATTAVGRVGSWACSPTRPSRRSTSSGSTPSSSRSAGSSTRPGRSCGASTARALGPPHGHA